MNKALMSSGSLFLIKCKNLEAQKQILLRDIESPVLQYVLDELRP